MPPEARWLPLFPLNTVLFPSDALPLQIFEERYKQMMQDCLDSDSKFGVVLIKAGAEVGEPAIPHSTGTVAHIVQVNRVKGGRMFISVAGQQRFVIKEITQYRPYMAAQVELLGDEPDEDIPPTEMQAIRQVVNEHVRLSLGLRGGWVREARAPSDPAALSYFIAGLLPVGPQEKQALLEEPTVSKRLEAELDLLRREVEPMKRRVASELRSKYSRQ